MMDRRNTVFVVVHGKKIMKVEIGTERQSRAGRKADISEVDVTRNRLKCRRIDPAMRTWNNTEHRAVIEDYIRTLLWTTGRKECRQGTRVNSDAVAGTTTMNITTAYSIKQTLKLATDIEQVSIIVVSVAVVVVTVVVAVIFVVVVFISRIFHFQAKYGWLTRPLLSCRIWKLIVQLGQPQPVFANPYLQLATSEM